MDTINVLCARTSHSLQARIVASAFDRRAKFAERLLTTLRKDFGDSICSTVIHGTIKLSEAAMRGVPIRRLAPYSTAHEDFADLAEEITGDPNLFQAPAPFPVKAEFSYFDPGASEVMVAGDFNDWLPSDRFRLKKEKDGNWTLHLQLEEGQHYYRFIVDGRPREDPVNPAKEVGRAGQIMSVLDVGRPKSLKSPKKAK
jgi:hypothetical protein